jgi:pantothenate kinase type III
VDTRRRICLRRSDFPLQRMSVGLPAFIDGIKDNARAVIAGGRGVVALRAAKILKKTERFQVTHLRLSRHSDLPVRFHYQNPAGLGADRIADALYACSNYPKKNVIIIDSGTAITVDAVSGRGEFKGGTILAGIETQLKGLCAAADTLPFVSLPAAKIPFPGGSTVRCMQAGAAHGTAGALNHLVNKYERLLGGKCTVLVTGGAWHLTRRLVDFKFSEIPDMTLVGMALYVLYRQ